MLALRGCCAPVAAHRHPCVGLARQPHAAGQLWLSGRLSHICGAKGKKRRQQQQPGGAPPPPSPGTASAPELSDSPLPSSSGTADAGRDEQLRVTPSLAPNAPLTDVASPPPNNAVRVAWRRLLKELSSLPRAIAIMFLIAGLSGLGTVIPQNKGIEYYIQNYPDIPGQKVLGFLTYDLLLTLELDHIYSNWYFYMSLFLLAASLSACTLTRQLPVAKVAQRWRFQSTPKGVVKMGNAEVLPSAKLSDLGGVLDSKGYQVFIQAGALYAFKGLAGRLGPIGVHAALLLILAGTSYSGFGGFKDNTGRHSVDSRNQDCTWGSVMCPEGGDFTPSQFMRAASPISGLPSSADSNVHVDSFDIDYRPDGSVAQFYSTLTLTDKGGASTQKTISVNDPFRYNGVTMYQTDWSLAAVTLQVTDAPPVTASQPAAGPQGAMRMPEQGQPAGDAFDDRDAYRIPLANLEGRPGISGRLWGGYFPLEEPGPNGEPPRGISVLARDPQSIVIYDTKGQFVGVRRPDSGKPLEVEGLSVVVRSITGATGLEIKSDPGVPYVYAGFGGLMITSLISYLSHSQVWACQDGRYVYVAGKSNRALVAFEKEFDEVLEAVPELPEDVAAVAVAGQPFEAPSTTK